MQSEAAAPLAARHARYIWSSSSPAQRRDMKVRRLCLAVLPVVMAGAMLGCSDTNKSPDVADNIRKSLDQAGYKHVSVTQGRDQGVVTLSGTVPTDSDKAQARSLAKNGARS